MTWIIIVCFLTAATVSEIKCYHIPRIALYNWMMYTLHNLSLLPLPACPCSVFHCATFRKRKQQHISLDIMSVHICSLTCEDI